MGVTFKPVVYAHQKRADGSYNIKIRITFKGVHRHLATNIDCTPQDLTRSLRIKDGNKLYQANELIKRMREAVSDLNFFEMERMTADDIVTRIRDRLFTASFTLSFKEWGEGYIARLDKSRSTIMAYRIALRSFLASAGEDIDINDITRAVVARWIEDEPVSGRTIKHKYNLVRLMFNSARDRFNDEDAGRIVIPRTPFDNQKFPPLTPTAGQRNLGIDIIQRMIDYDTDEPYMRATLDLFLLSFLLMGANLADLCEAKIVPPVWEYNRKKTRTRRADKAYMRVYVPKEAAPYLSRLTFRGIVFGRGVFKGVSQVWIYTVVGRCLAQWAEEQGIEKFTLYAARHSFASIARSLGVEKATIDECLCHIGDYDMANIYAERDWDIINEANSKVIAAFRWREG